MLKRKLSNPHFNIVFGFLGLIAVGCVLLLLPFSTKDGISFVDALFVSASSVCITGLTPVVVASTFTAFGKTVIVCLIQIGGLGFTTVAMAMFAMLGLRLGISEKYLVQETLGNTPQLDYKKFLLRAVIITATAEIVGFFLNLIALRNDFSGWKLVAVSLFHAVSAFNNAGIDVFGDASMTAFSGNVLLLLTTALLTIVGGLGFLVINDLCGIRRRPRRISVHTKLVLIVTAVLLTVGTLGIFFSEWGKVDFLNAFFMSAMTRTCGFTSQNLGEWNSATISLTNLLMWIGAAPASTGGGIKCTTFFVICAACVAFVRGKPVVVFGRRVEKETVLRAMIASFFSLACIFCCSTVICAIEPELTGEAILTETVSAFSNVGLSTGITGSLCAGSKILLTVAMFTGRIGFLTVLATMRRRWNRGEDESIRYVKAEIMIG